MPSGPPRLPNQPTLRDIVEGELEKLVRNYMQETMDLLGVKPDNIWLWMVTEKTSGENIAGPHRCRHHISLCLQLSLKEAHTFQLLEVLHQEAIDGKTWQIGALLLPRQDPIYMEMFDETGEDSEASVVYQ